MGNDLIQTWFYNLTNWCVGYSLCISPICIHADFILHFKFIFTKIFSFLPLGCWPDYDPGKCTYNESVKTKNCFLIEKNNFFHFKINNVFEMKLFYQILCQINTYNSHIKIKIALLNMRMNYCFYYLIYCPFSGIASHFLYFIFYV